MCPNVTWAWVWLIPTFKWTWASWPFSVARSTSLLRLLKIIMSYLETRFPLTKFSWTPLAPFREKSPPLWHLGVELLSSTSTASGASPMIETCMAMWMAQMSNISRFEPRTLRGFWTKETLLWLLEEILQSLWAVQHLILVDWPSKESNKWLINWLQNQATSSNNFLLK